MDSQMYIPFSLGITTLVSLFALVIGQVMTLLKLNKMASTPSCMMAGAAGIGAAAAVASKAGWFKTAWEFIKLVGGKVKDKFKDKAADKIADSTVETVTETVVAEEPKKV